MNEPVTVISPDTEYTQPVSVGQRMMWLMNHYQGAYGALNCPVILCFEGDLDAVRLTTAWQQVVDRHEALRTCFAGRGHEVRRIVKEKVKVSMVCEMLLAQHEDDASPLSSVEFQAELVKELRTPVEIQREGHRIRLWKLREKLHVLCITQHHLVTDAISCGQISREIGLAYAQHPLSNPIWQFSDFVDWETQRLCGDAAQRDRNYWTRKLAGMTLPTLPSDKSATTVRNLKNDTISMYRALIPDAAKADLEHFAKQQQASLFSVVLALFLVTLHRLTGQYDLSVSTLLANRAHENSRHTVGFLANMVLLRTQLSAGDSLAQVITKVRETVSGAVAHQAFPYQLLPTGTVPSESARDIVFQMFSEATHQTAMDQLTVTPVDPPDGLARRFDLDLAIIPSSEGMRIIMAASNLRFRPRWARGFLDGFVALATGIPTHAGKAVIL